MNNFEIARNKYKPKVINLLFIAESPPKGGTFFYFQNSNLYRAVEAGFASATNTGTDFLSFFKSSGCYLDDLCLNPINGLENSQRVIEREKGIIPLSERLSSINPKGVVILMKAIEGDIRKAISKSTTKSIDFITATPFPAHSEANRKKCIEDIGTIVKSCIENGIIQTAYPLCSFLFSMICLYVKAWVTTDC